MKSSAAQIQFHRQISPFPTGTETFISSHAKKMALITMSCVAIALAGILTRGSFTSQGHNEIAALTLPSAPMAQPLEPARAESLTSKPSTNVPTGSEPKASAASSREVRFAQSQLQLYSNLLESLQQRMNEESSVDNLKRMRAVLSTLNQNLEQSRVALAEYEAHRSPFTEEGLKGDLFTLQESGQKAVSAFIDADNFPNDESLQVFKVSRTGQ